MNSMESLAKANRFQTFGAASLLSLIVAGYITLAGTAFMALNEQRAPAGPSVEDGARTNPTMVCDCHYETPNCATN